MKMNELKKLSKKKLRTEILRKDAVVAKLMNANLKLANLAEEAAENMLERVEIAIFTSDGEMSTLGIKRNDFENDA